MINFVKNKIMEKREYYTYCHYYETPDVPFYIGRGKYQKEKYGKYYRAKRNHTNGNYKSFVIDNGNNWKYKILSDNLTFIESNNLEINLIKYYGRKDKGTGILINLTDGGGGSRGCPCSNKSREEKRNRRKIPIDLEGRKEYIKEYNKQYNSNLENKEKRRKRDLERKEYIKEYNKQHNKIRYQLNKEIIKEKERIRYQLNKEIINNKRKEKRRLKKNQDMK